MNGTSRPSPESVAAKEEGCGAEPMPNSTLIATVWVCSGKQTSLSVSVNRMMVIIVLVS